MLIKANSRNYNVDPSKNRIDLLDNRFYHDEATNTFVPSVTTILSAFPKGAAFYEWMKKAGENADEIRDEAGRRGSVVHGLTERFDLGEEVSLLDDYGDFKVKLLEWSMFERYVEFRDRFPMQIEFIEQNFVSTELGFAGTADRIVIIDGKRYLIDIKTSNYIGDEYWLQLAAYKKLSETLLGSEIDGVGILWLNAKTRTKGKAGDMQGPGYQLITRMDTTDDYELFLNTKRLWEKLNGTMKPKQISYSLSHQLLDTMPAQLVCKKCGVADDIVIGEGKGPHFAAITCGSCGGYIKWATEKEVNSLTIKNK